MRTLYKFQALSIALEDDGSVCFRDGERALYRGNDWRPAVSAFLPPPKCGYRGPCGSLPRGKSNGYKKLPVVLAHHGQKNAKGITTSIVYHIKAVPVNEG